MDNAIEKVSKLLGDYYNSEEDIYQKIKQELQQGVWLSFNGPQIKPLKNPLDWIYFIEIISKGLFAVNYEDDSIDMNVNYWIFPDERIECVIERNQSILAKFKTDLTAFQSSFYGTYGINKQTPEIENNKTVKYRVFLKLTKVGSIRTNFENQWFKDPKIMAQKYMNKIQQGMNDFPKTQFVKYITKVNLMKRRLELWGHKTKNKKELLRFLPNLPQQDFGVKDVVALELLATIFFNEKLSNDKMFSNVNGIVSVRRKKHESK